MDRTPRRKLNAWIRKWDEIESLAAAVNDRLPTLLAASAYLASDAFGSSSLGAEISSEGDHADPVAIQALAELDGPTRDIIADHLREIAAVSSEIQGHLRRVHRLASIVVNRKDPRTYDTGGNCNACDRYCSGAVNDRLRAMYCWACYQAWCKYRNACNERNEAASHDVFERRRRLLLEEQAKKGQGAA